MREKCEVLMRLKCAILVHTFFCPRPKMSNLDFGVLRRRCSLPNFDGVLNANLQIGHFIMRTEKLAVITYIAIAKSRIVILEANMLKIKILSITQYLFALQVPTSKLP